MDDKYNLEKFLEDVPSRETSGVESASTAMGITDVKSVMSVVKPKVSRKSGKTARKSKVESRASGGVHSVYLTDEEYLLAVETKACLVRRGIFKTLPTTKALVVYLLKSALNNK